MSSPPSGTVETTRRFARKLHRRYALFTLGVVVFIGLLIVMNLRGLKEAIQILLPIFLEIGRAHV